MLLPADKKIPIALFILLLFIAGGYFLASRVLTTSNSIESPLYEDNPGGEVIGTPDEPETAGIKEFDINELAMRSKQAEKDALASDRAPGDPSDTTKPFSILILGIDRRHGDQTHWRTDVIQLLTISANRKNAVVTHIPRDVWAGSYKINAVYNLQGPDAIRNEIQKITGQRPDRIIRIDFDAFVWVVDSVGGLTIDVPNGFTDSSYPNDRQGSQEAVTVTFETGEQTMDGETALIYTRSRKGTNGEGSDYARGTRQQFVMRAIIDDFFQPANLFNPKTAETLYNIATKKIYTDFTLVDTKVLFEVLKNYKDITVRTLGLDTSNYLIVPSARAAYGGAWTLIPKDGWDQVHQEIITRLQ